MPPVWPFPTKSRSQSRRVDQGWDLQYPGVIPVPVLAVESGTLSMGGPDPGGFGPGYPVLTLDKAAPGGPAVYYGHTFVIKSLVGHHVPAGTPVGRTGGLHSGGNAYADSNWLEIGFWAGGPTGNGAAMKSWLSGASGSGVPTDPNGTWFVISVPTSAHGSPKGTVSKKPFPIGAVEISGPYATRAIALKALAQGAAGKTGLPGLPNPLSGVAAIGDFFSKLSDPHTWLRIAEVTVGLILLAVGVNALLKQATGTSPVEVIGKVADKVPKVVPV